MHERWQPRDDQTKTVPERRAAREMVGQDAAVSGRADPDEPCRSSLVSGVGVSSRQMGGETETSTCLESAERRNKLSEGGEERGKTRRRPLAQFQPSEFSAIIGAEICCVLALVPPLRPLPRLFRPSPGVSRPP